MDYAADIALMLADCGRLCTVGGAQVQAIFDNGYQVAPLGARGMGTTGPQLTLATASVPASPYGLAVTVPGEGNFTVAEAQPDGTGITTLILERAA